jgi:aquaporin Z
VRQPPLARTLLAELIGTFALVFGGAGAIIVNESSGALGHVGIAITFALAPALLLRASLGDIANVGATLPSGSDRQSLSGRSC